MVAASRSEQPFVPQLRVTGDAWEIGASDLAFDAAGAEQIFSEALVDITREQAVVVDRTEGWPAGLYLAALIARHNDGAGIASLASSRNRSGSATIRPAPGSSDIVES